MKVCAFPHFCRPAIFLLIQRHLSCQLMRRAQAQARAPRRSRRLRRPQGESRRRPLRRKVQLVVKSPQASIAQVMRALRCRPSASGASARPRRKLPRKARLRMAPVPLSWSPLFWICRYHLRQELRPRQARRMRLRRH